MLCRICYRTIILLFLVGLIAGSLQAQFPTPNPPPPPKARPIDFASTLSADGLPRGLQPQERALILRESEIKDRLKPYLQLMEGYLDRIRKQTAQGEFYEAVQTLIIYAGLATSATRDFTSLPPKKRENQLKKLELSLRSDMPFLEAVRRDFNYYYGDNVQELIEVTKRARIDALNALFGDTDILRRPGESEPNKPDAPK